MISDSRQVVAQTSDSLPRSVPTPNTEGENDSEKGGMTRKGPTVRSSAAASNASEFGVQCEITPSLRPKGGRPIWRTGYLDVGTGDLELLKTAS